MKAIKNIKWLIVTLCNILAFSAGAWNITINFTGINQSDACAFRVTQVWVPLRPAGGGADFFSIVNVSYDVGAGATVNQSTTIGWPADTLPGAGAPVVVWQAGGYMATNGAEGSASWPGGGSQVMTCSATFTEKPSYNFTTVVPLNGSATNRTVTLVLNGVIKPEIKFVVPPGYGGATGGNVTGLPGNEYDFTATPCDLPATWLISDALTTQTNTVSTNSAPNLGSTATNNITFTNVPTPTATNAVSDVGPATNTIVYSPGGGNATDYTLQQAGQALDTAIWTASKQAHSDANGIVNAINGVKSQAHADAGTLKATLDSWGTQAHSDANGIYQTLVGGTNLMHFDLQAIKNALGSNGFQLTASNLATEATAKGMAGSMEGISNLLAGLTDVTNADIASEGTQKGISNLLAKAFGGTNWFGGSAVETNYALETTLDVITNILNMFMTNSLDTNGMLGRIREATNGASALGMAGLRSAGSDNYDIAGDSGVSSFPEMTVTFAQSGPGAKSVGKDQAAAMFVAAKLGGTSIPDKYLKLKTFLVWFIYFGVFVSTYKMLHDNVLEVLKVPQATTAGTTILGTNANFGGAIIMAGIIVGAIAVMVTAFLPAVLGYEGHWITIDPWADVQNAAGGFGTNFALAIIPLPVMISAMTVLVTFRVGVGTIATGIGGAIKFVVGF